MNRLSSAFLTYSLPVLAVAIVAMCFAQYVHAQSNGQMFLCKRRYALCTSARCTPKPGSSNIAVCTCDVLKGPSMATVPCNQLEPQNGDSERIVYSTFSLVQFQQGLKSMVCPSGNPWTNCLNKICTVDPHNPFKAICLCTINRTGKFTTAGGNCDTSTCATAYWSGATLPPYFAGIEFMVKALHLSQSPAQFCPTKQ